VKAAPNASCSRRCAHDCRLERFYLGARRVQDDFKLVLDAKMVESVESNDFISVVDVEPTDNRLLSRSILYDKFDVRIRAGDVFYVFEEIRANEFGCGMMLAVFKYETSNLGNKDSAAV